jgi:hypothetical protein
MLALANTKVRLATATRVLGRRPPRSTGWLRRLRSQFDPSRRGAGPLFKETILARAGQWVTRQPGSGDDLVCPWSLARVLVPV